jgi:hypothetical protein
MKPRPGQVAEDQLSQQDPGLSSAIEPGSAATEPAEIYLPTRSTIAPNYLTGMINAHYRFATLRKQCHVRLPYYKLVDSCAVQNGPTFLDWRQVTIDLLQCEREVGELVQQASVRRDRVWAVYLRVIDVQERWIPWAEREVGQIWRQKEKKDAAISWEDVAEEYGLPELQDQFTSLIDLLRRLVATTRLGI